MAELDCDAYGRPLNPRGRTGVDGRGLLGKWGPNHAADPIVTRLHPVHRQLQMIAIQRRDTKEWAIPGGSRLEQVPSALISSLHVSLMNSHGVDACP